jgi:hypothetical protein
MVLFQRTRENSAILTMTVHQMMDQLSPGALADGTLRKIATAISYPEMTSGVRLETCLWNISRPLVILATQMHAGNLAMPPPFITNGCVRNSVLRTIPSWLMKAHCLAWKIYMPISLFSLIFTSIATLLPNKV